MDDTIREKIIQEFMARAWLIRAGGSPELYATDIGTNVLRARSKIDPAEVDCVVIFPQPEEAENKYGKRLCRMSIKIEGIAKYYEENPSVVAEKILGDLIACFLSDTWDRRRPVAGSSPAAYLDPYAESIIYQGGGTSEYPDDNQLTVGAFINMQITYWTQIGDPRAQ